MAVRARGVHPLLDVERSELVLEKVTERREHVIIESGHVPSGRPLLRRAGERHPPSGSVEQTETATESEDVVEAQKVPGKLAQSALVAQPAVQSSPWVVKMHAFAWPVKLPLLGPIPVQSEEWTHALVHQRALHVRPAMHVLVPDAHGSPTPDSAQTAHFIVKHESIVSSVATLVG
jgi:hypothetical protein